MLEPVMNSEFQRQIITWIVSALGVLWVALTGAIAVLFRLLWSTLREQRDANHAKIQYYTKATESLKPPEMVERERDSWVDHREDITPVDPLGPRGKGTKQQKPTGRYSQEFHPTRYRPPRGTK